MLPADLGQENMIYNSFEMAKMTAAACRDICRKTSAISDIKAGLRAWKMEVRSLVHWAQGVWRMENPQSLGC